MDLDELAAAVKAARLNKKHSVARAAREAGIDRVTFTRVEDGLPVQDVKRYAVESYAGITRRPLPAYSNLSEFVAGSLNADLASFTDRELLDEVEARMLMLAGRLAVVDGQEEVLEMRTDDDGNQEMVSHSSRLRQPSR